MMSKRAGIIIICLGGLVAAGCGSFNNSFNHNAAPAKPPIATLVAEEPNYVAKSQPQASTPSDKVADPSGNKSCDLDPYVKLPPLPELPTKEFQAAAGVVELEIIERRHIRDLRSHYAEVLRLQQKNQMAFMKSAASLASRVSENDDGIGFLSRTVII